MKAYTVILLDECDDLAAITAKIVVEVPEGLTPEQIGDVAVEKYKVEATHSVAGLGDNIEVQYVFEGRLNDMMEARDTLVGGLAEIFGVDDDPFAMR